MIKKSIKEKLKEYFFINPSKKLRVRQIEREIKIPLPSVIRYVKELEKEKILKNEIIGETKFFTSNKNSKFFLREKKLYNIKSLNPLIDFFIEEYSNPSIILFGSYSRGEDIETSDIDLYIESFSKKELNLEKYEKKLMRKIQIFKYKNIKEIKNKELINNILNGIRLTGYIEVF